MTVRPGERRAARRLAPFGVSIFSTMSARARAAGAINLGQGFPDFEGPDFVREAACAAIRRGPNQYAPSAGIPDLRARIAASMLERGAPAFDVDREITVTSGCTEAIAAVMLGLVEPGDEVVLFEPWYDAYPAAVAMAGGVIRGVPLRAPDFTFDDDALAAAIGPRTRFIVVNTPHNPTGRVFDRRELETIARRCLRHDLIAITDEVYEHLIFEGAHHFLAGFPGMADRTITLSSLGKTFDLTGWKIGWAVARADLTRAIRAAHQFLVFAVPTPLQYAAAEAIAQLERHRAPWLTAFRARRDLLTGGLRDVGFRVQPPQGTCFVLADHTAFGFADDIAFCDHLLDAAGVAAIPTSVFMGDPARESRYVRFAFCKETSTLQAAIDRMRAGLRPR
ncbi:MAG: aminotransferase class I/II-fold pyridoxal phosphate-dependent enzyme [Phycisphaeraceae bacterium]|nr:aminotransferase class I/II-fold pyridoxal phosphate-dependent enzyme [Phycisphaeraceae bacterium]